VLLCIVQICEVLRADGLVYQDVDDMLSLGYSLNPNIKTFDAACFDGHYVTGALSLRVVGSIYLFARVGWLQSCCRSLLWRPLCNWCVVVHTC
jgi:hypothetical protein